MKYMVLVLLLFSTLVGCGIEWFPDPRSNVQITSTSLPGATVGTAYSQTLSALGGTAPYSWSVTTGTLPAGLTLSGAGVISGTPTTAATSTFTVTATDSSIPAKSASANLSVVVAQATNVITLAPGQTFTLAAGQSVRVPSGTTFDLNGVITTVTGDTKTFTTSAGAVVTVPSTATGTADYTVTAQAQ